MINSILNMFGGKNYGKLLLKTISTKNNWQIDFFNPPDKETKWFMVDDATNSIIANGILDNNNTYIVVDLSASSGNSSLYINVDENGNNLNNLRMFSASGIYAGSRGITFVDLDVLPKLTLFNLYNTQDLEIEIKNDKGTNQLKYAGYFVNCSFKNINFINNSKNTIQYLDMFYGYNKNLSLTPIEISNMPKLTFIRIKTYETNSFKLDSFDFKLNNPSLTYIQLININTDDNLVNISINDETTSFNVNSFNYKIETLDSQSLQSLKTIYLGDNKGDSYVYKITDIVSNLPALETASFYRIKTDTTVLIDNHASIKTVHFLALSSLKSINLSNNDKLTSLNFYYNTNITDIDIQNNQYLNYLRLYHTASADYNFSIDSNSMLNLETFILNYDKKGGEFDFSNASKLKSININANYFTKFNMKNGNNTNITSFSGHTQYVDAAFLVDDPNLAVFTNATFRSGDTVTNDQTTYDNA